MFQLTLSYLQSLPNAKKSCFASTKWCTCTPIHDMRRHPWHGMTWHETTWCLLQVEPWHDKQRWHNMTWIGWYDMSMQWHARVHMPGSKRQVRDGQDEWNKMKLGKNFKAFGEQNPFEMLQNVHVSFGGKYLVSRQNMYKNDMCLDDFWQLLRTNHIKPCINSSWGLEQIFAVVFKNRCTKPLILRDQWFCWVK